MKIELNTSRIMPVGALPGLAMPAQAAAAQDQTVFAGTEALREEMTKIPDVRPEAVERGKALIASINYPPPYAVDRIASLLALNVTSSPQTPGNPSV
jgi:hypothetical protein